MSAAGLRRLLVRLGLAAFLVAGLLEITLRVLRPFSAPVRAWIALPQDDVQFHRAGTTEELLDMSVLGFRPFVDQSGFVTNSRGFRTPEYAQQKAPGSWRVVALGDSFTFASGGVPWGDLWTTRLAARMAAATTRPVELVNLGVPAVGVSYGLRVWQLEGAALQPDLVLYGLFVGNDFNDERWTDEGGAFWRYGSWSCAARLLRNLVRGRDIQPLSPAGPAEHPPPDGARGGYAVEGYERLFATRAKLYADEDLARVESRNMRSCDRGRTAEFELLFGRVTDALRRLRTEVEATGAQFAVVVMPARCQINAAERAPALAWCGQPDSDFDWDAPQRRLAAFLQGEGIPFVDVLPVLREAAATQEVYARGDTHWSPEGNAVVAAQVAKFVVAQGWPPAAPSSK